MMSSNYLFSTPFLLILVWASDTVLAAYKNMYCDVSSCGVIPNISYPFWLSRKQPSYCGFPDFEIKCIGDTPLIAMPFGAFEVKNIFYENNSFVVADHNLVGSGCPVFYRNISFIATSFEVNYSVNKDLYVFYNCSKVGPNFLEISCAAPKSFSYLGGYYGSGDPSLQTCREVYKMPVLASSGSNSSQYIDLIRKGFLLDWTVTDCKQCTDSSGQCGYSNDTNTFICICDDRLHWKSCESKRRKKIVIAASVGGVGVVIVACCAVICWCKHRKRPWGSMLSNLLSRNISSERETELQEPDYHTHIFSYDELMEATNSFDSSRELGDGGFGTVYKGKLRDGRTVAVKRLYENNYRRLEQFMNEVDILSRLRHQNLVTLYGCTSRQSPHLLLVYEYIPNGTVADHLHGTNPSAATPLAWHDRMSVAIETAEALTYLHAIEPQIIHRDVKSNNILLDNNFRVKVADFGLSRLFPLDATHVSTMPQGTPGYVDPEYHQCYQLTDRSDVYSFGVVLAELISSKPAVDISRTRHEVNLANMAVTKIQRHELDQLVDPALGYHSDVNVKRMITQVAEVAFACLQQDRDARPSIREVLERLRDIESGGESYKETDDQMLTNPVSPDTVMERWQSVTTTPHSSE